jgi:hypothetical protein
MLVAAIPLAIVTYGIWWAADDVLGRSFLAQVVSVSAALVAGGAVYLVVCRALRLRELRALLSLRGRSRGA